MGGGGGGVEREDETFGSSKRTELRTLQRAGYKQRNGNGNDRALPLPVSSALPSLTQSAYYT